MRVRCVRRATPLQQQKANGIKRSLPPPLNPTQRERRKKNLPTASNQSEHGNNFPFLGIDERKVIFQIPKPQRKREKRGNKTNRAV